MTTFCYKPRFVCALVLLPWAPGKLVSDHPYPSTAAFLQDERTRRNKKDKKTPTAETQTTGTFTLLVCILCLDETAQVAAKAVLEWQVSDAAENVVGYKNYFPITYEYTTKTASATQVKYTISFVDESTAIAGTKTLSERGQVIEAAMLWAYNELTPENTVSGASAAGMASTFCQEPWRP